MKLGGRGRGRSPKRPVFPGGIAGASLKPVNQEPVGGAPAGVFPGGIAGASLKRRPGEADGRSVRAFSPAESPGPH